MQPTMAQPFAHKLSAAQLDALRFGDEPRDAAQRIASRLAMREVAERQGLLPLCLVGDSTVRNQVVQLQVSVLGIPCNTRAAARNKTTCGDPTTPIRTVDDIADGRSLKTLTCLVNRSFPCFMQFDRREFRLSPEAAGCRTVLVSLGHWTVSAAKSPKQLKDPTFPWQLSRYEAMVGPIMEKLRQLREQHGVRVGWLSALPFPLNDGTCGQMHGPRAAAILPDGNQNPNCNNRPHVRTLGMSGGPGPPMEWRFPHVLHELNERAEKLARANGVEYVDVWQPAFDLEEMSTDASHYIGEPVAPALAVVLMRWLLGRETHCRPR